MKLQLPIGGADLKLLRIPAIIATLCLITSVSIYLSAQRFEQQSSQSRNTAQENLTRVQNSIQQISQEEATIVRYIDRYRFSEESGFLDDEDRLAFLEQVATLRTELELFPISVEIGGQTVTPLQYSPDDPLPGNPLSLRSSSISMQVNLLHEEELSRLIEGLYGLEGLLQPIRCSLLEQSPGERFTQVTENVRLDCNFNWYTVDLEPAGDELAGVM
jgi:hypothetical protein